QNCDLVNYQHFRLVSSMKVKIDLVIVFIFKDPFSSRLSLVLVMGKRSLTHIFRHSFRQRNYHWCWCVCVCVCVRVCVCVCVWVCVCLWEVCGWVVIHERKTVCVREGERVCVCVHGKDVFV